MKRLENDFVMEKRKEYKKIWMARKKRGLHSYHILYTGHSPKGSQWGTQRLDRRETLACVEEGKRARGKKNRSKIKEDSHLVAGNRQARESRYAVEKQEREKDITGSLQTWKKMI